jgi:hypothetical protein
MPYDLLVCQERSAEPLALPVAVKVAVKPPETTTPTLSDRRKPLIWLVELNGIEPMTS